jgi:hypothetical protein
MDLSALGALVTIAYIVGIFAFQWFTDWYFNASKSIILDSIQLAIWELDPWNDKDP